MIIEYQDHWKSITWEGVNPLTLVFRNDKGDTIKFTLNQQDKDAITLFRSGYRKGLRIGREEAENE